MDETETLINVTSNIFLCLYIKKRMSGELREKFR